MRASAIRCLAASQNSSRIAAALFEHKIQIWDLETRTMVNEFETVFSFGGNRLALDSFGERCVAAGWTGGQRGGVACYEVATGKLLWHRPDLLQTQRLRFAVADATVWCVPESGPTKRLNTANGETLDAITGLSDIFDSNYSSYLFLEKRKRAYFLRKSVDLKIPALRLQSWITHLDHGHLLSARLAARFDVLTLLLDGNCGDTHRGAISIFLDCGIAKQTGVSTGCSGSSEKAAFAPL